MQENVISLLNSLTLCTTVGISVGIVFGITILSLMAVIDIFKVSSK